MLAAEALRHLILPDGFHRRIGPAVNAGTPAAGAAWGGGAAGSAAGAAYVGEAAGATEGAAGSCGTGALLGAGLEPASCGMACVR